MTTTRTESGSKTRSTRWIDAAVMAGSLLLLGLSAWFLLRSGTFSVSLAEDEQLSWHLVRSSGMVAYMLLLASTVWGLFISSQIVKDWSPGPVSMTLHSTVSWLALLLGLVHALLLLFDGYYTYTLADIFVPFTGPYRPEFVGLGTLAFWVILLISLSFPVKKRLGHKNWKLLHYTSYAAFALISVHGLSAGTDGQLLGFRILVSVGVLLVVLLLAARLRKDRTKSGGTARTSNPRLSKNV